MQHIFFSQVCTSVSPAGNFFCSSHHNTRLASRILRDAIWIQESFLALLQAPCMTCNIALLLCWQVALLYTVATGPGQTSHAAR